MKGREFGKGTVGRLHLCSTVYELRLEARGDSGAKARSIEGLFALRVQLGP